LPDALAFHELRVARIVRETPDTRSLMLEVPPTLRELFAYQSSHFLGFQVRLGVMSSDGRSTRATKPSKPKPQPAPAEPPPTRPRAIASAWSPSNGSESDGRGPGGECSTPALRLRCREEKQHHVTPP